jgi:hypothetical protein
MQIDEELEVSLMSFEATLQRAMREVARANGT